MYIHTYSFVRQDVPAVFPAGNARFTCDGQDGRVQRSLRANVFERHSCPGNSPTASRIGLHGCGFRWNGGLRRCHSNGKSESRVRRAEAVRGADNEMRVVNTRVRHSAGSSSMRPSVDRQLSTISTNKSREPVKHERGEKRPIGSVVVVR